MDLAALKKELRKEKKKAREALPEEEKVRYSADICRRIADTPEYKGAGTIFVYKWSRGEVRLDELERLAEADGKTLVYPLCISRTEMTAIEPGTEEGAWKTGAYGIMEPDPDLGRAADPGGIDLVIAPCTSFDENCRRLGMGGGYYDRYLPKCRNAAVIAAAFEVQKAEEIPAEEYDHPVDAVATEQKLYR